MKIIRFLIKIIKKGFQEFSNIQMFNLFPIEHTIFLLISDVIIFHPDLGDHIYSRINPWCPGLDVTTTGLRFTNSSRGRGRKIKDTTWLGFWLDGLCKRAGWRQSPSKTPKSTQRSF
jgi:hypothetical protein